MVGGARYGLKIRVPHALVMTSLFRRDLSTKQKLRSVMKLAIEHASNLAAFASIYKAMLTALKWTSRHVRNHQYYGDFSHNNDDVIHESAVRAFGRAFLSLIVDGPVFLDNVFNQGTPTVNQQQRQRQRRGRSHTRISRAMSMPLPEAAPPGHPEHVYHSFLAGAVGGYLVWGRYSSVNFQIVLYLASRVSVALYKKIALYLRRRRLLHEGVRNADVETFDSASSHHNGNIYPFAAAIIWGLVMALFEESPELLHPSLKTSMDEIYRHKLSFRSLSDVASTGATTAFPDTRQTLQYNQRQYTL